MNFLTKSLSIEIENFISFLKNELNVFDIQSFTKSAFCQGRSKIKPEVFLELSSILIDEFYTDNEPAIERWKGLRVLAVDGSFVSLPQTKKLKSYYGEAKNNTATGVAQARVSVLYDVLNKMVLDGSLAPLKIGERELAEGHLTKCGLGDLIIYDRGYPSYAFIHRHIQYNIEYLIRVKTSFSNLTQSFIDSNAKSKVVDILPGKNAFISDKPYNRKTPIKLRLVRIDLPSGEVELLMTSLIDTRKYPNKIFKKLYFKRWNVESFYDELKNKLKLEYFSGQSPQNILQDFYAALFISNVQTIIVNDLTDEIHSETKSRKYKYKVNTNLSYGYLKDRVVKLFFNQRDSSLITIELKALFKKHLVPIRPDRSELRSHSKYRNRAKPKTFTNHKAAF